jgi:putative ABC transport system permease protein
MRVRRNLRLSLAALSVHGLRTVLAMTAAATGVAAVIVLTSVGDGARAQALDRIERLGRNTLVITPVQVEPRAGRARQGSSLALSLRAADATAIERASPAVQQVAPVHNREMPARYRGTMTPATVIATTPSWLDIRRFRLAGGRTFTEAENDDRARVAVLGHEIRSSLFGDTTDPAGRVIRIGRVPFVVIGWLDPVGSSLVGGGSEDDRIIVPLETGLHRLFDRDELRMVLVQARSAEAMTAARTDASAVLRARHDLQDGVRDDFDIADPILLLSAELAAKTSFQRLLTGLGLLSMFVGGAGILSIMLLAVRERRSEIGLRIALGARSTDIATQFIAEALLIACGGGLGGMLAGLLGRALTESLTDWRVGPLGPALGLAAACVLAIGILAGAVPAIRASRLDPIASLHSSS